MITHPAIRYHGGKFRLAQWIMGFFPEHRCYVEPFGGGAGVLLHKPRSYAEVYNDLDSSIVNFFRILQDETTRRQLLDLLILTPYARAEFELAWERTDDPIEEARRLCIRAQMGFGSAGATKGSTGFRIDTKREYGTAQQLWAHYPCAVAAAGQRFHGIVIENRPAIDVMQQHDAPTTLHYVDPPYVLSTRVLRTNREGKKGAYRYEMSDEEHADLLTILQQLEGYVVLSGYANDLYMQQLNGWSCFSTESRISAGRGTALRTECVWINPQCQEALDRESAQMGMFA